MESHSLRLRLAASRCSSRSRMTTREAPRRPTADDLAAALTPALRANPPSPRLAPLVPGRASLDAWLELLEAVSPAPPRQEPSATRVSVVAQGDESLRRARRLAELAESVQMWMLFRLRREATASIEQRPTGWFSSMMRMARRRDAGHACRRPGRFGADVVTAATRPADGSKQFSCSSGDPGALGLVENHYGVVGLARCSLAVAQPGGDAAVDPDRPLFARLALGGARVVSIPFPLSGTRVAPARSAMSPGTDSRSWRHSRSAETGHSLTYRSWLQPLQLPWNASSLRNRQRASRGPVLSGAAFASFARRGPRPCTPRASTNRPR